MAKGRNPVLLMTTALAATQADVTRVVAIMGIRVIVARQPAGDAANAATRVFMAVDDLRFFSSGNFLWEKPAGSSPFYTP